MPPPKLSSAVSSFSSHSGDRPALIPLQTTLKRIQREVADLKKEDLGPIILAPSEDNIFVWNGSISGPEGSVYEGGVFEFEVHLAPDYPCVARTHGMDLFSLIYRAVSQPQRSCSRLGEFHQAMVNSRRSS